MSSYNVKKTYLLQSSTCIINTEYSRWYDLLQSAIVKKSAVETKFQSMPVLFQSFFYAF